MKLMQLMMGLFCICWIPYIVMNITVKTYTDARVQPQEYILVILDISKTLMVANIAVNPFIYAYQCRNRNSVDR